MNWVVEALSTCGRGLRSLGVELRSVVVGYVFFYICNVNVRLKVTCNYPAAFIALSRIRIV